MSPSARKTATRKTAAKYRGETVSADSTVADIVKALTEAEYAERYLRILNKQGNLIPLIYNPIQTLYLANSTPHDLVLKARQVGISTAVQGKFFHTAHSRSANIGIMSHEAASTQKFRRTAERFYKYLPDEVKPPRKYANSTLTSYPETDSEVVIATAGNKNTGRGGTYTHIHASEVAFYKDAEAIIAGFMQGGEPNIVMESTPNGAQGYFFETCMEALDGNSAWRLHFYPWFLMPEYSVALDAGEQLTYSDDELALIAGFQLTPAQIKWRRGKQRELKNTFLQEYPEDVHTCFLRSGLGYFGELPGVFVVTPGVLIPDPAHRYVAGLDFGQSNDYTVCSVFDATRRVQVDLLRVNQLSWSEMRKRVASLCVKWNVKTLWAEKNSMGGTNIEELHKELAAAKSNTTVAVFNTSNESKAQIMSALHEALYSGLRLLNLPEQRSEFSAYKAVQLPSGAWQLTAPAGQHDDTVIADALACHGMTHSGVRIGFA